jgi:hypothetical protein
MFISYQTVRNTFVAGGLTILGGGSYLLFAPRTTEPTVQTLTQYTSPSNPSYNTGSDHAQNTTPGNSSSQSVTEVPASTPPLVGSEAKPSQKPVDNSALLASAMKIANAKATPNGGKDILGSKSPWKVNLYDDNSDGQWDRAKLDTNRDDIDDEKWTFKEGRWEKEGGEEIWNGERWQVASTSSGSSSKVTNGKSSATDDRLSQYRAAMKIAGARATGAQGKDVLGAQSKWKLNLYDDDGDGQWDRAKLDTNRDDFDDEKWAFKEGRWEKDGGEEIWNGERWQAAGTSSGSSSKVTNGKSSDADDPLSQYRAAMKIAGAKATGAQGKDVLGAQSKWKLNLYDDDGDGQWDRAKLDTNRDDIDDEKWAFKSGRWEKEGGNEVWNGEQWQAVASSSISSPKEGGNKIPTSSDPTNQYLTAMKIATSKATGAQGKDVLGAKSKWKLNLYDDDGDGQWDRAKLDTNRDGVDDEKWNFKKGRWEKDSGAKIWNGSDWVTEN